jgi:hypothetical protein
MGARLYSVGDHMRQHQGNLHIDTAGPQPSGVIWQGKATWTLANGIREETDGTQRLG